MSDAEVTTAVRRRYAAAATAVAAGDACCTTPEPNELARGLYDADERASLPSGAVAAALGCANPVALAALRPGQTVLDLGSGGGIDVLLSATRVGPAGFVYGLDMTDEMLALAERSRVAAGAQNVRFLRGRMEAIPLDEASVDVVLSNCVVNLSPDKARVFAEAYRVLRPAGRLAIADIATLRPLPAPIRDSLDAWTGCIAGALEVTEIEAMLCAAGFVDVEIQTVRTYGRDDLAMVATSALEGISFDGIAEADIDAGEGALASVFVRAVKPAK